MKIAFATYPTAFEQPGGGEVILLTLRERLILRGLQVDLLDPWSGGLSSYDVLHYFSSIGTDLYPYYRRYVPLIVTPCLWPSLPPFIRARRDLRRGVGRVMRRPLRSPYEAADIVTPHSTVEANLLMRNYDVRPDQIDIVPHGVDERFGTGDRTAFAKEHGLSRYVLCLGRIDPIKNQLRLIHAVRDVDLDLVVVGGAGEESYLAACRAAAGPRTTFLPPLPRESQQIVDAVRGAACVVVPSIYEIWSLVAHEAGVAGVPIAATKGGSMKELLSPWATFFDPLNESEMREAVLSAVDQGLSSEQSRNFLGRASWEAVADHMVAVYERASSKRPLERRASF